MADILTADDIADIQSQIAPEETDELIFTGEIWRMPGGVVPGGAGVDEMGVSVTESADPAEPDDRLAKVAEYPVRIGRGGLGEQDVSADQLATVTYWTLTFNWADNPDIRGGDRILIKRDEWKANSSYAVGDIVQPTVSNQRFYRCKVAGTSGAAEPTWPLDPKGASVVDGTVTWEYVDRLRTFGVRDPGGDTTYRIVRLVRCEEIKP